MSTIICDMIEKRQKDYPVRRELNFNFAIKNARPEVLDEMYGLQFWSVPIRSEGVYVYLFKSDQEAARFDRIVGN